MTHSHFPLGQHVPTPRVKLEKVFAAEETNSPPVIPRYPLHPQAPEWHPKGRQPFRVQMPTTFLEQNALQLQQNRIVELLTEQHRKSTLPRPQVPIFNGNPISYRSFIRAFESLIESKTSDSCDRLYYP